MLDRKILEKVLTQNNWGMYLKGRPLEEIHTENVGVIYKICEVTLDKLVEEYNIALEKEE